MFIVMRSAMVLDQWKPYCLSLRRWFLLKRLTTFLMNDTKASNKHQSNWRLQSKLYSTKSWIQYASGFTSVSMEAHTWYNSTFFSALKPIFILIGKFWHLVCVEPLFCYLFRHLPLQVSYCILFCSTWTWGGTLGQSAKSQIKTVKSHLSG